MSEWAENRATKANEALPERERQAMILREAHGSHHLAWQVTSRASQLHWLSVRDAAEAMFAAPETGETPDHE